MNLTDNHHQQRQKRSFESDRNLRFSPKRPAFPQVFLECFFFMMDRYFSEEDAHLLPLEKETRDRFQQLI